MKTHVIDGVTYVEVDRKAEVGDKILIIDSSSPHNNYTDGSIFEVNGLLYGGVLCNGAKDNDDWNPEGYVLNREYVVIETEETTVDTSKPSPDLIDLLTSLSRKIVSLESQLRDTQGNVEKLSQELANTRHRLMKYADRFAAIEDKVEMLTDDIVTLDSRSQVLNAINKYYAEGSR
jgi:hypothetical protein